MLSEVFGQAYHGVSVRDLYALGFDQANDEICFSSFPLLNQDDKLGLLGYVLIIIFYDSIVQCSQAVVLDSFELQDRELIVRISSCIGIDILSTFINISMGEAKDTSKDCLLWFDGCNNCSVENGRIRKCTKRYCSKKTRKASKCLKYKSSNKPRSSTKSQPSNKPRSSTRPRRYTKPGPSTKPRTSNKPKPKPKPSKP